MANPLQSSSGRVLVMDLPNDAAAREVADKLAQQLQFGRTIIVTDADGNEIYVAKIRAWIDLAKLGCRKRVQGR